MDRILARSTVYGKVGELMNGKLTPTEHVIIPGITSKHFKTKTFIYHTDGSVNFSVRDFVYPAIYIYLKLTKGVDIESIGSNELRDDKLVKKYLHENLNHISIVQDTNIPEGKGLCSGSADILSALLALNKFFGTRFNKEQMYKICSKVVPTDPLLDKEIDVMFNPANGTKVFNLIPRQFGVIYFDSDSNQSYNAKEFYDTIQYNSDDYSSYNSILELYQTGCMLNKDELIFEATTKSAELNEKHAPKPHFNQLLEFAKQNNVGVFAGHTGSILGLLMDSSQLDSFWAKAKGFIEKTWGATAYKDACETAVLKFH